MRPQPAAASVSISVTSRRLVQKSPADLILRGRFSLLDSYWLYLVFGSKYPLQIYRVEPVIAGHVSVCLIGLKCTKRDNEDITKSGSFPNFIGRDKTPCYWHITTATEERGTK